MSWKQLALGDVEIWEAVTEGAFWTDVPANVDVVEATESEIGLPLEAFDVLAEEVLDCCGRGGDWVERGVDPEGRGRRGG